MTAAPSMVLPASDFVLPDQDGRPWRLRDHLGGAPLMLVFFRGHWCPYCRRYLAKLQGRIDIFSGRCHVVAISPEPPATSRAFADELGLSFPILADEDGSVIDAWGVRNRFTSTGTILPHPAVFILDAGGVVRFRSIDRNYKKRTTMRRLREALDAMA